ncbi:hypothetical protein BZG36_01855 [Bifiguratus adelaidae]|uniref:Prokaryotic-type class I peptide chain release factors domain-containing protein n=1 Tax=Bifiguratus adelaidae TaxID=1938954 RepID=A0A261Y2S7_9FUNG|nr:hypothetical protein BZG36_01855 [Bifiguratus adelaidae]
MAADIHAQQHSTSYHIKYSKSSGPGGQNVNKVNSKVEVRFDLGKADWIPAYARSKLFDKATKEGYLVTTSDTTRSPHQNLQSCLDKLVAQVTEAVEVPKEASPETKRRVLQLSWLEDAQRERQKRFRSKKKQERRKPLK